MMEELMRWLQANKICYVVLDKEVVEIIGFGKMFLADLSNVRTIFRGNKDDLKFNLMENPEVLIEEDIFHVAFPFGKNWYYFDLREEFRFNILKYIGERKPPVYNIPFVNLGVHTPYELLNGSGDIGSWVKKAKLLGHEAIGICDKNTLAATLSLQKECRKEGIRHVFGYSFTIEHLEDKIEAKVYCQNKQGLKNLLRIHKTIMVDSDTATISVKDLTSHAAGNVLVFGKMAPYWMKDNPHILVMLKKVFGELYYQVDLSEYKADRIDAQILMAAKYYFDNFYMKELDSFIVEPVLICDNYYLDKDDSKNKIILNKVATGAAHEQSDDQYFKDTDEHYETIRNVFSSEKWNIESVFERMCANTVRIANRSSASYDLGKMYMPQYIMTEAEESKYGNRRNMFSDLLEEGLNRKIPKERHKEYRERLKEEVYIIESTNNVDYFLIQWDMIKEAKRRGIATGIGRGSAGGSLVSYLLDIISIDPIKYGLIFSRFLVPERCGLNWVNSITIIGEDIEIKPNEKYIEVKVKDKQLLFFKDAEIRIIRGENERTVYADELQEGDEMLIDNRDLLWTLSN